MGELPVFTCQAHVFSINPHTKKSWIPASSKAVDVNFFFDSNKQCYRIISVEDGSGGKKVIINSTLTEKMAFKKTSQKFGQWADSKTGVVHGLGFNSENELIEFITHFKQYVEASKGSGCSATNGRSADPSISPSVTMANLASSSQTVCANASLGPPAPVPMPPSLSLMPPAVVSVSQLASSSPPGASATSGHFDISNSHQVYHPSSSQSHAQLQQQLRQAQNQIRRLEDELHSTRRQASALGIQSGPNSRSFTAAETISSTVDGTLHPVTRTNDLPDLREGLSRLEMNGALLMNGGAGEDCSADGSSATLVHSLISKFTELPVAKPPRTTWTADTETVRALHSRLGRILHEAVDLHNQLGALLP